MELDDSFTDKFIKRRRARKDYLMGKILDNSTRMKRIALVEKQQIPDEDNKESPKHFCVASEHEAKENASVKQQEMKKSNCMREDEPMEEEAPLRLRGLAALRKKHSVQDGPKERKVSQDTQLVNKPSTYVLSTKNAKLCSTRNRLANLAADINSWEDDLKRCVVIANSSTEEAPAAAAKEVKDTSSCSFEPSNLPLSARKAIFEQAAMENIVQYEKQTLKPELSVDQRSAMFVNSPRNKLGSKMAPRKSANASPDKSFTKVGSPVKSTVGLSCRSPPKPSTILKGSPSRPLATSTRSPVKTSTVLKGSPSRQLAASTRSPAKSSFALSHHSPVRSGANGGRATTPTKSLIPKPQIQFRQQQWAKIAVEPENTQPVSSLINMWEKLSSCTYC